MQNPILKIKINKDRWILLGKISVCMLVLMGVGVLHYYAIQWSQLLKVRTIVIQGNEQLRLQGLCSQLFLPNDSLLFSFRLENVKNNVLKNSWVRSVRIKRIFPSTLAITIIERVPVAMVSGTKTFYVDADGIILAPLSEWMRFDLPLISSDAQLRSMSYSTEIPFLLRHSLAVAVLMKQRHRDVYALLSEIHSDVSNNIILYTYENGIPVLLGKGNIDEKLSNLSAFWIASLKSINGEQIHSLDARFQDRIIVKWKNTEGSTNRNRVTS
ncbi:MAG: FtsQ-type POTRA domain-containing protein [Ignavibacteria bacterium]|nr:FtsQ-type POTRA domain-containing protein [Ignavibacteria bacterium]